MATHRNGLGGSAFVDAETSLAFAFPGEIMHDAFSSVLAYPPRNAP
jgi:hypothetical protein